MGNDGAAPVPERECGCGDGDPAGDGPFEFEADPELEPEPEPVELGACSATASNVRLRSFCAVDDARSRSGVTGKAEAPTVVALRGRALA